MLVFKNAKIMTGKGDTIESGLLLVKDGKIVDVVKEGEIPKGAEVIDLEGKIITPGFIDAHSHVGIGEVGVGWEGQDYNEISDPVTPHLRAIDGILPEDGGFKSARSGGVTTIMTGPGSANVIGGETVVIRTAGKTIEEMIVRNPAGMKAALGENPKRVYGVMGPKKSPITRMASAALLRETLVKAENYKAKLEKGEKDPEKMPERDLKMEAMLRVLNREMPLRLHAHRADDIMTGIRVAREFNIDLTIEHCTEGHKIAPEIAKSGFPAIVGPSLGPATKLETKDITWETPKVLHEAGVKVAIMTDHPVVPIEYLGLCASLAMKAGLPEEEALKAITLNAAEILGIADRVGSLEKGKEADFVIWDKHPFDVHSRALKIYMRGELVQDE